MTNRHNEVRRAFLHALQSHQVHEAIGLARLLFEENAPLRECMFIRKCIEKNIGEANAFPVVRVALLSSFSLEFIHDALIAVGFLSGLCVRIYQPGFAQFRQEILNPASGMYAFHPDVTILAVEGKHIAPDLYKNYLDRSEQELEAIKQEVAGEINSLIEIFRKNIEGTLLIHNFAAPEFPELGILDGQLKKGQIQIIGELNSSLYQLAQQQGVFIVNYQSLVNRFGYTQWFDKKLEYYAQAPVAQLMLPNLASEYAKYFRALKGLSKKCLVVDLDNTLWGGIVGEDGPNGIKLNHQYPGSAFIEFQEAIFALYKRGIILAIASKNNPEDVDEVFESHPNMLLKKDHFASMEINWNPKSESIKKIAKGLNISLEHMVFVDDNPVECEQVREALPTVSVIHLGKQPEHFVNLLSKEGLFDTISFSLEDRSRSQLYKQRAQSEELKNSSASLEDFYRNLKMSVCFMPINEESLVRAAQLTQKTNQFNLTTIRYTEVDIAERMRDSNWVLRTVQVKDRYGDNGIVGLVMTKKEKEQLSIDTFLLSCRVIGRTIETAMLAFILKIAKTENFHSVVGKIIPTQKNVPARDFYRQHNFKLVEGSESGWSTWQYAVGKDLIPYPDWFAIAENDS